MGVDYLWPEGTRYHQLKKSYPLLGEYLTTFSNACLIPDTWLVVIGYSFKDSHINAAIAAGVKNGLRVVIVDTAGPEPLFGDISRDWVGVDADLKAIWRGIVGFCSFPFSVVFSGNARAGAIIDYCLG